MAKLDSNASGTIDLVEFLRLVEDQTKEIYKHSKKEEQEQNILDAWCVLGGKRDKSGTVDANRMKTLLSTLGVGFDVEKGLQELDTDHSGNVEFNEFSQLLRQSSGEAKEV